LDQSGQMALYFPDSASGNSLNKFPKYNQEKLVHSFPVDYNYRVNLPTGTDNFFMLASEEAIPNPYFIFNQQGVYTDAVSRGAEKSELQNNPLSQLLDLGNDGARNGATPRGGGKPPVKLPASWSLKKYSIKCTY
jgi:hypothetical protein